MTYNFRKVIEVKKDSRGVEYDLLDCGHYAYHHEPKSTADKIRAVAKIFTKEAPKRRCYACVHGKASEPIHRFKP